MKDDVLIKIIIEECKDIIRDGNWSDYEEDILKKAIPIIENYEKERITKALSGQGLFHNMAAHIKAVHLIKND